MRHVVLRAIGLLLAAALPSVALATQSDPRLIAAVRGAQEGQSDSARATVQRLLARTPASDTLYPQILYTAAAIANEAAEMRRHLQRVTVEFPTSSWTDDALLRLAQLDYATREFAGATRYVERIATDFPAMPLFPYVAYWAARIYFESNKNTEACRWLANGLTRVGSDVEAQTQLGFLHQRCQVVSPSAAGPIDSTSRPDTTVRPATPAPAPTPTPTPPAAQPVGPRFRVQIAALGTQAAAEAAARKAEALGYRTMTIRENGLYKVRAGEFSTRVEAQDAAASIKAKLGGATFVVQDQ